MYRHVNLSTELVGAATDVATFRESVRTLLHAFSSIPDTVRLERTHTIALASTRPRLAAAIASVQDVLTDGWKAVLAEAQQRGFMRAELDTRAAAVLIQSLTIGRIIDDAGVSHLGNERLAESFFELIDRAMLSPGD